jgi:radical SAM superfamily enzyme YgiQ (UPF0313 family)
MRILYLPNAYSQQRQREKKANIYPVRMAMEAEWYRKQGHYVDWGYQFKDNIRHRTCPYGDHDYGEVETNYDKTVTEPENLPFLTLPKPDRAFTRAKEYTSGNYKYLPGTHIISASGCWWGNCNFCVENGTKYEVRPVEEVIQEIEECKALGFKEVFDDSATFPMGEWCNGFCSRVSNIEIRWGCNCRISDYPFSLMSKSGLPWRKRACMSP